MSVVFFLRAVNAWPALWFKRQLHQAEFAEPLFELCQMVRILLLWVLMRNIRATGSSPTVQHQDLSAVFAVNVAASLYLTKHLRTTTYIPIPRSRRAPTDARKTSPHLCNATRRKAQGWHQKLWAHVWVAAESLKTNIEDQTFKRAAHIKTAQPWTTAAHQYQRRGRGAMKFSTARKTSARQSTFANGTTKWQCSRFLAVYKFEDIDKLTETVLLC